MYQCTKYKEEPKVCETTKKCEDCHAKMIVELMVSRKTSLHSKYLSQTVVANSKADELIVDEPRKPESKVLPPKTYTLVRLWNDENACVGNF